VQALRLTLGGLLGEITSANRQYCSHIIFECGLSCPSNRSFRPAAPWYLFECELRSLESSSSGQQRLRIIFFGPAAPPNYSSVGYLVSRSALFILFERGLRSFELFSSSQQRLCVIRARALIPRIIFFGPAAPPYSSSAGFGPSNRFLRASSASIFFECELRSLESFSSGQQRLHILRVRA
jgi:hypothetical protein